MLRKVRLAVAGSLATDPSCSNSNTTPPRRLCPCGLTTKLTLLALLFVFLLTFGLAQEPDCNPAVSPPGALFSAVVDERTTEKMVAMTRDIHGNVYVTGRSGDLQPEPFKDILTVKYSPSGQKLWSHRWNGPASLDDEGTGIVVDPLQNVYVCGIVRQTSTDYDMAVRRYTKLPNQEAYEIGWTRIIGRGTGNESARAIALDPEGFVYVAGGLVRTTLDPVIVKLDRQSGESSETWGELTGQPEEGMRFFNYGAPPQEPEGLQDQFVSIVVDGSGGVIAAGRAEFNDPNAQNPPGPDYAIMRVVRLTGQFEYSRAWFYISGAGQNVLGEATAVAADSNANAYITGSVRVGAGLSNAMAGTIKIDPLGNLCWFSVQRPTGWPETSIVTGNDIALDQSRSSVYVVSLAKKPITEGEEIYAFVHKFATTGCTGANIPTPACQKLEPMQDFPPPPQAVDGPLSAGLDRFGNLYVGLGTWRAAFPYNIDLALIKLAPCCETRWRQRLPVPQSGTWDIPTRTLIETTDPMRIWLSGSRSFSQNSDYYTVAFCQREGDVDGNGIVDDTDLAIVLECFGQSGSCLAADLNNDGAIDDADMALVIGAMGNACPPQS